MSNRLYLLDCMALLYRAHFALIKKPIFTSDGINTSALYGFANTVFDILHQQQPKYFAAAFDTSAPTPRHQRFPAYKAHRDETPEDLRLAFPNAKRFLQALNIPILEVDGLEADDLIGSVARAAERQGDIETYMVTPDKDFGQLVDQRTFIYKPGRQGSDSEILGIPEICERWGVSNPLQVIDILGLMGDAADNIPGVKGVGEKTAIKLIQQFGSIENLLTRVDEVPGKLQQKIREGREMALLSKELATIIDDAPLPYPLQDLIVRNFNDEALKSLFIEFEFNALGRRIYGETFKAGRQRQQKTVGSSTDDLFSSTPSVKVSVHPLAEQAPIIESSNLGNITTVAHEYELVTTAQQREQWSQRLLAAQSFCFDTETDGLDALTARLLGVSFCVTEHQACYWHLPEEPREHLQVLEDLRPIFASKAVKIGHNLKFDLRVLYAHRVAVVGPFEDTMLIHALVEPDQRHGMDYLSERYLNYTPIPISRLIGEKKSEQISMAEVPVSDLFEYAAEDADVTWQLAQILRKKLEQVGQRDVYQQIEAPLIPVLAQMEHRGVEIDLPTLKELGDTLEIEATKLRRSIEKLAGLNFNLNSPKQLGEVLFDHLKLSEKPRKTATGQYQTNEQTLLTLQGKHPIIEQILSYREITKLKNTYVDTLPAAVNAASGRIHTTFHQLMTATGRMASSDPNLQNIPIRSGLGKQIRKAFQTHQPDYLLFSADYSQIELRVLAAISGDEAMQEAFQAGHDIHQATAARVFNVELNEVLPEMRRTAKMVNFGIIYGISAFGLAQRLGNISRTEAARIIEAYFREYPKIQGYMESVVAQAREQGYVSTLSGRRRYLRDINTSNAATRNGVERMAMNAPIQGTAADMIKIAMIRIHDRIEKEKLSSRMLLQVHDELLFETPSHELPQLRHLVTEEMQQALPLNVPILTETGYGTNWLDAH